MVTQKGIFVKCFLDNGYDAFLKKSWKRLVNVVVAFEDELRSCQIEGKKLVDRRRIC